MRRFLTITTLALTTLASAPVFAAGPSSGNGYGGKDHVTESRPAPYDGFDRDGGRREQKVTLTKAELKKAKSLEVKFERDKKALMKKLSAEKRTLAKLRATRNAKRSQIVAAEKRVDAVEAKLTALERTYRARLAAFLTPAEVRFFLSLS
ncbi:MAG: hypothetical protein KC635_28660 [Myxococcales bacterium]|nr:hypothetical protein [Myxococcales bacterium]MCB9732570.1 hypothetical protein [Deltaproteobacteria bacterium]